jgi:hypothetical protein
VGVRTRKRTGLLARQARVPGEHKRRREITERTAISRMKTMVHQGYAKGLWSSNSGYMLVELQDQCCMERLLCVPECHLLISGDVGESCKLHVLRTSSPPVRPRFPHALQSRGLGPPSRRQGPQMP